MQPGVCFGKETHLLTGERLVFLVETNVYRRQKRFVLQAETNVLALPKIGLKAVERENNRFLPKTNVSPANKNVSDLETILLFKTLV